MIGLPMYAELVAYVIEGIRPAPESQVGYVLTHFHAYVLQRFPIDTFLSPTTTEVLIGGLGGLALISLTRFILGSYNLNSALRRAAPITQTPYAYVLKQLQATVGAECASLPPVLVCELHLPIAFTTGIRQPRIYLSAALLQLLNEDELLAVLCHEWAHVRRRDTLWTLLIRLQRDMLWFIPGSHLAWHSILRSQDEACDRFAATITGQPLVLARALVKLAAVRAERSTPSLLTAQTFTLLGVTPRRRVLNMIRLHESAPIQPQLTTRKTVLLGLALLVLAILPPLLGS